MPSDKKIPSNSSSDKNYYKNVSVSYCKENELEIESREILVIFKNIKDYMNNKKIIKNVRITDNAFSVLNNKPEMSNNTVNYYIDRRMFIILNIHALMNDPKNNISIDYFSDNTVRTVRVENNGLAFVLNKTKIKNQFTLFISLLKENP